MSDPIEWSFSRNKHLLPLVIFSAFLFSVYSHGLYSPPDTSGSES